MWGGEIDTSQTVETWLSPGWIVSGIGILLLTMSGWYYSGFTLASFGGAGDGAARTVEAVLLLFELVVMVTFSTALVYGGYWLSRTRLTTEHQWWVVLWVVMGLAGVSAVVALVQFNQLLDGRGLDAQTIVEELLLAAGGGGIVGFFTGVTNAELRQTRAEVTAQRDAFESLNAFLRHNVLNGLQNIVGYADLLADRVENDDQQYLEGIRSRSDQVLFVVDNARALTREIASDPDATPVDLSAMVVDETRRLAAEYEDATLERTITDEVHVDGGEKLPAVLRSLIGTLIQQANETEPTIDVTLEAAGGTGLLTLAGPNIPQADGDATRAATASPAGESAFVRDELGLDLTRQVVRQYGGDVWLDGAEDGGAVVKLQLPLTRER